MANYNRVKCSASLNYQGQITPGAAAAGFRALTAIAAATYIDGYHPYTLEDANGNWEIGYVRLVGGVHSTYSGYKRKVVDSSAAGAIVFANNATGLTLTQTPFAGNVFASPHVTTPPEAAPGSLAVGDSAVASGSTGIAIGNTALAQSGADGIAIGSNTVASGDAPIAVGSAAHAVGNAVAVGTNALANTTESVVVGHGAAASYHGEVAVGSSVYGPHSRSLPVALTGIGDSSGTVDFKDGYGATIDLLAYATLAGADGPMRIRGSVCVSDSAHAAVSSYSFLFNIDYWVWLRPSGGVAVSVLGTPSITNVYAGTSASIGATIGVNTTTGLPTLTTSGMSGTTVNARAMLHLDLTNAVGAA